MSAFFKPGARFRRMNPFFPQRSARGLRISEISTLEIGKQEAASLLRSGFAHHLAPVDRLPLTPRSLRPPIGPQVLDLERLMMIRVRVQGRQQRRPVLHQPHADVTMTMNPTLVALGQAEPPLQIEIVPRQSRVITPDEQPRCETPHHPGHLLSYPISARVEPLAKGLEGRRTLSLIPVGRIQGRPDRDDILDVLPNRLLGLLHGSQSPIEEPGQSSQERLGAPPVFASRFRWSDWRTSPNASAIRRPGGWSGPP
jgi:hypothetical protein